MARPTAKRAASQRPAGAGESSAPSGGVSDFNRLMTRVGATILAYWGEVHPELASDRGSASKLAEVRKLLVELLADENRPLPRATQRERDRALELIHGMEGLMRGAVVPDTNVPAVFNPWVFHLLTLNYAELRSVGKAREAKADLLETVKSLTKESKGRPPKISPTELREMKELRDQGWTYGKLARKFGGRAERVRLTLKYHYPGEKAT